MASVLVSQLLLRYAACLVAGHHLRCLRHGELGVRHVVSRQFRVSPLRLHVIHVVLVGAKEQVVNQVASRVVATVKNHHPRRDLPASEFPSQTVNQSQSPTIPNAPVSHVPTDGASPNETLTVPPPVRLQVVFKRCVGQPLSSPRLKGTMTRKAHFVHRTQAGLASRACSLQAIRGDAITHSQDSIMEGP